MKIMSLKFNRIVMLLLSVCVLTLTMTSCSNDDETDDLIGYWANQNEPNGEWADLIEWCVGKGYSAPYEIGAYYQFVNESTVKYGFIDAYSNSRSNAFTTVRANGRTYYLVFKSANSMDSYKVIDKKVYIINGPTFTMRNGLLYQDDNSSNVYVKIK